MTNALKSSKPATLGSSGIMNSQGGSESPRGEDYTPSPARYRTEKQKEEEAVKEKEVMRPPVARLGEFKKRNQEAWAASSA